MERLALGAVAYDPKVVTIWEGFRQWFGGHNLKLDYVLYPHYEKQVDDLAAGRLDVAWNSPLAWVRARRMVSSAQAVAMRDTDRDLTSVVVVRADSPVLAVADLTGMRLGTGAVDSPQATLIPLSLIGDVDAEVVNFNIGTGLHGDHIGGEREAARALMDGSVDAACMIDSSHLLFAKEGILPAGATRILAQTPPYDHCNMTIVRGGSPVVNRFVSLLLGMDYADPAVRPLLDLEGLTRWLPGRVQGYKQLEAAVDRSGFYDTTGRIIADRYDV
jgi:phosphonate transport system substrate-binding protein